MKTKLMQTMFLSATLAAFLLPAAAQSTTDNSPSTTGSTPSSTVNQAPGTPQGTDTQTAKQTSGRKDKQQDRIGNGMGDGELTPGEASTLEQREKELNREEKRMRAANGGKLTDADKAQLQKQQDQLSKAIYKQKHDSQGVPTMDQKGSDKSLEAQHRDRQQERIDKGLKDGSLSPAEAAALEKHQSEIRQQTAEMRSQDGGKLTAADKAQIKQEQKQQSRNIHYQKHDKQHK
jgi:hypothetical protein